MTEGFHDDVDDWRVFASAPEYSVSRYGQVWSNHVNRIMKPTPNKTGHLSVCLMSGGERQRWLVHRMVAISFLGQPPTASHEVCHNNGDSSDNRLENLRWGTRSDNLRDAVRHGTHYSSAKLSCVNGHPFNELNTIRKPGNNSRVCRTCANLRNRAYRDRRAS